MPSTRNYDRDKIGKVIVRAAAGLLIVVGMYSLIAGIYYFYNDLSALFHETGDFTGFGIMVGTICTAAGVALLIVGGRLLIRFDAANLKVLCIAYAVLIYIIVNTYVMRPDGWIFRIPPDVPMILEGLYLLVQLVQFAVPIAVAVGAYRLLKPYVFSACDVPLSSAEEPA